MGEGRGGEVRRDAFVSMLYIPTYLGLFFFLFCLVCSELWVLLMYRFYTRVWKEIRAESALYNRLQTDGFKVGLTSGA